MDTTANTVILKETVKRGKGMVGVLAAVLARSLALLAGRQRGHQSFRGRWASDGRRIMVELTSFAVDLLSIKSGCCQLLIASKARSRHHISSKLYLENMTSKTRMEMK